MIKSSSDCFYHQIKLQFRKNSAIKTQILKCLRRLTLTLIRVAFIRFEGSGDSGCMWDLFFLSVIWLHQKRQTIQISSGIFSARSIWPSSFWLFWRLLLLLGQLSLNRRVPPNSLRDWIQVSSGFSVFYSSLTCTIPSGSGSLSVSLPLTSSSVH